MVKDRELTAIERYYYMHNPIAAIKWLFKRRDRRFKLPDVNIQRLWLYWYVMFSTDCSGRSTAKSHDAIAVTNAKLILIPHQEALLLGQDKKIGVKFFDEYVQPWIDLCPNYKQFVIPFRGTGKPKPTHSDSMTSLMYRNGSIFETFSADWRKDARTVQSFRYNRLIFNEWTSYNNIEAMEEQVKPCITRTQYEWNDTWRFQTAMEKYINEPLGLLTNEEMALWHKGEKKEGKDYKIRPHLEEGKDYPFEKIKERFYNNFKITYHFDYEEGLQYKELRLKKIKDRQSIRDFFRLFLEGNQPYRNQIIYDGSAKRPSDESYQWIERINAKLGKELEECMDFDDWLNNEKPIDHRYSYYSISVDDLPREFDGIIYDSSIINDYRQNNLKEDYERIYGGKWIEGFARKPYDPALIRELRVKKDDPRYFEVQLKGNRAKKYISAIDAAKGTEALRKGIVIVRGEGKGRGADAGMATFELGDSTIENPDKLVNVYKAEDVRSDPMAFDIQNLLKKFENMILMGLDPGGGGGDLADSLKKSELIINNVKQQSIPVVPIDYEDGSFVGKRIIVFISRGTELLKMARVESSDEKALWKSEDMLPDEFHNKARLAIQNKTCLFPTYYTEYEKIQMINKGELSYDKVEVMENIDLALKQMTEIQIELDKRTGKPKLSRNGLYTYIAPKKKDLAYCVIYGLYLINVYRTIEKKIGERNKGGIVIVV